MASVFPPVPAPATASGYLDISGLTTIVWGTSGMHDNYIVVSASSSERVEEIDIEQGTGFEAAIILLRKGVDLTLEVIDDTTVTPPSPGTVVTLSSPFDGGTGIAMLTVSSSATNARKREGMRSLTFKSFNAINLTTNVVTL